MAAILSTVCRRAVHSCRRGPHACRAFADRSKYRFPESDSFASTGKSSLSNTQYFILLTAGFSCMVRDAYLTSLAVIVEVSFSWSQTHNQSNFLWMWKNFAVRRSKHRALDLSARFGGLPTLKSSQRTLSVQTTPSLFAAVCASLHSILCEHFHYKWHDFYARQSELGNWLIMKKSVWSLRIPNNFRNRYRWSPSGL